ncbi:hypothetical protein C5167_026925 [Papaver somniferum]|uniref:dirigent protein 2-like n=1 Tax=Papaver somniferum TaxID=3469 RepID=UPI000E6F8AAA|nr:dirigent protein 2-like [Papaver somniferum]RZC92289.1 hypothetical protein C5167_026925 [Papaver somniferum]
MGMADIHSNRSFSVAIFSIFLIFYVSKVAVAGKLFPALGLDPVQLGLRKEKFNHFRVYWHDNAGVSNPTTIQVAGANSTQDSITGFGAILVFDDALTEGSDPSSKRLGRAQGTYTFAGIDEPVVLVNANIVFTTGKYNGSTLGIMGRNMLVPEVRELIIIGGTGLLRFARGYVEARTHLLNIIARQVIVEYNLYVYHY